MGDLASIVKAYDIRGVVPDQLDEDVVEAVGAAFAWVTGAETIVTMHDMRTSSGPLVDAFGRGVASQGADVVATAWAPPTCSTTPAVISASPAR